MKKILLIHPGKRGVRDVSMPLALLTVAKPLLDNGYKAEILDCRISDYRKADLSGVLCVGITSVSGEQLVEAMKVAEHVRLTDPRIPIIWGGPHATILPEQTVASEYVDIAVLGEGEETLLELVRKMDQGQSWDSVKGISFKKDGKVVTTPPRELLNIDAVSHLPYHLLQAGAYPNLTYKFEYLSSRGCPHSCGFCSTVANFGRTWRGKSPEVVIDELAHVIELLHPEKIVFVDANFFRDKSRAIKICRLLKEKNWPVEFFACCRCDYFSSYEPSFVNLIREAGFTKLGFGAESGSDRVLKFIGKHTTAAQILETTRKCGENGLIPVFSFMVGFPTETDEEVEATLRLCDQIRAVHPGAMINGIIPFSPFPRTPLTDLVVSDYGYSFPEALDAWQSWQWCATGGMPWLSKSKQSAYETIFAISSFRFVRQLVGSWSHGEKKARFGSSLLALLGDLAFLVFGIFAHLRWKYRFFRFGIEWKAWEFALQRFTGSR